MPSKTSIDAYHEVERSGLLSDLRLAVYQIVCFHGPISSGEVWNEHLKHHQRQSLTPRFKELERMGAIRSAGERQCRLTGYKVIVWESTNMVPEKLEHKQRTLKSSEIEEAVKKEREECARIAYGNGSSKIGNLITARSMRLLFDE